MASSRVATAVTTNAEDIKFGVKQANDSLKKFVGVAKDTDNKLKKLVFFEKLKLGLAALRGGINLVTQGFDRMLKAFKNPASAIPFLSSFADFIKSTNDSILDTYNLGVAIGANVNQMQALQLAAKDVGLEFTQLYEPISKLPRKIQEAAAGFGDSVAVFSQLPGIDINALRDLGATQGPFAQLKVVADALKRVTDQNQKLYLLTKIFEETGPKFQRLFALGSEGIEKFEKLVVKLGLSLKDLDVAKALELNRAFDNISKAWNALTRASILKISPELIVYMERLTTLITDPAFRTKVVDNVSSLLSSLSKNFYDFAASLVTISDFIVSIIDVLRTLTGVFQKQSGKGGVISTPAGTFYDTKFDPDTQGGEDAVAIAIRGLKQAMLDINARIAAREKEVKAQGKKGDATFKPIVAALDKVTEKISYRAVSNAASGAAPGKLSAADATTQAGVELMLKSLDDGYKETKEVTMLKKIEKVLQKIEKKAEAPPVNLQGAE